MKNNHQVDDFSQIGRVILATMLGVVILIAATAFIGFAGFAYVVYQHFSSIGCPAAVICDDLRSMLIFSAFMSTVGFSALLAALYVCYREIICGR
ncbi:hypothetical protein HJA76_15055 [Rhizobium bangladeshense]|uniref:hypothetical protein n=1 Tax=Rhizobium bangladeshense TaxID=1138189 RepID=UPI001C836034|nr:hypothetical protein [Rhizobium bangladeshense]MBX4921009.1 hypothetical protein [Rhizobium bangladeshense]